jgi:polysaccharide deacetylase 2 family uncharacterized protein YibQ
MSETPAVEPALPRPPADTGPSWLTVFAGLSFAATLAVLAGVIAVRFAQNRPVNLTEPSARVSALVEKSLAGQYIAEDSITVSESRQDEENGDYWTHYEFDVVVPQRLDPAGVAKLVREELEQQNVVVQQGGSAGELSVWLSNYQVASLRLEAAPVVEAGKTDFRVASVRLAEEVRAALTSAGVPEAALFMGVPSPREDAGARWYQTDVEARLPEGLTAETVLAAIAGQVSFGDALVRQGAARDAVLPVEVLYRDRLCVQLLCSLVPVAGLPAGVPAPSETVSLNDVVARALDATEVAGPLAAPVPAPTTAKPERLEAEGEGEEEGAAASEADMIRERMARAPVPPPARGVSPDAEDPVGVIILDDGGYGGMVTERVLKLDSAVTLSILPNTPHGVQTAQRATEAGFEVMLHMPMETDSTTLTPFPGQINTGMTREEIHTLTLAALEQVPGAVGSNNHTGSKFTSDPMRMEMYLEMMKEKGLYFVDSVTQAGSKAYDVAVEMGVPSNKRDVFLDDDPDPAKIRQQFAEFVRVAKRRGQAIAIGHFRETTLDVLEQELPRLEAAGVRLVPASELVK